MNCRLLSICLIISQGAFGCVTYGKSYLSLRPRFEAGTVERVTGDVLLNNRAEKKNSFLLTPFGGRSVDSSDIACYLLPNGKSSVIVAEDGASYSRDINANFMGVVTVPVYDKTSAQIQALYSTMTYASCLSLCPKRDDFGIGAVYRHWFSDRGWFDIATSLAIVQQALNPCESIINAGGTGPNGFGYQSLTREWQCNSEQLNYGKLYCGWQKKVGVPAVELRVGGTGHCQQQSLTGFIGLSIPTGGKPCPCYLFAPIIGNNGHLGLFGSLQGAWAVRQTADNTVGIGYDVLLRYLVPNTQTRSFDLKNKPWSRYMWVWKNDSALEDPDVSANSGLNRIDYLINYSTLCADVSPQARVDAGIFVNVAGSGIHFKAGYHLFMSQQEKICLRSSLYDKLGLSAINHYLQSWTSTNNTPVTRSFDEINSPTFFANPDVIDSLYSSGLYLSQYVTLTSCDLDTDSAATPAQCIHTLACLFGYSWQEGHPKTFDVGISYDLSGNKAAPNRWLAWLTVSAAF